MTEDEKPRSKRPKHKRAITKVTLAQSFFLTFRYFFSNRLLSYAGNCSFGLLFSFIPVVLMITIILVQILHASSETILQLLQTVPQVTKVFNVESVIKKFSSSDVSAATPFSIFLGFFIFWMARRFFASIFDSLQCIFHTEQERRPLSTQILVLVFEVIIVVLAATVIFLVVSLRAFLAIDSIFDFLPKIGLFERIITNQSVSILQNALLFIVTAILYKAGSGTKPPIKICILSAGLATLSFWLVRAVLHLITNSGRYAMIYGVMSGLILTLVDIFFFFVLFLFFAQFIFTCQFFDELLLGELYLLPKKDDGTLLSVVKRSLFIRPDFLIAKDDLYMIHLNDGELVYKEADKGTDAYYLVSGKIRLRRKDGSEEFFTKGDFFGEVSCVLKKQRESQAQAVTKSEIVRIDGETFELLIAQNPSVARKVLGQISGYFNQMLINKE